MARTQKKARRDGRTVVWVDEAAFYLLAGVVRTYAPRGHTPVLYAPLTRDHLSVISGITAQGRLLVQMQAHAFNGAAVAGFLAHLLCHINPDEGVWNHLKHVELRNGSCHDQNELRHELRLAIARLRHKSDVIRGFIKHCGY